MKMTPQRASELLKSVLTLQAQGKTWAEIAVITGTGNPRNAKREARKAAKITQQYLFTMKEGRDAAGRINGI